MLKKIMLVLFAFTFLLSSPLMAQVEDSLETDWEDEECDRWDWDWDWKDNWGEWEKGKPFMELNYGLGRPEHDKLKIKLAKIGLAELKLGYSSFYPLEETPVTEFRDKFAFVSRLATALQNENSVRTELKSELLRFGFGKRTGYGYDLSGLRILPYNQEAMVWSQLEMKDFPVGVSSNYTAADAVSDTEILNRFDGNFRFGTLAEGGVRVEIASMLSFNAGYEAAVIFPRHLFWKHLVSFAIESAAQNALDEFIEEVIDSSPLAAPVVNFLLKNGLSYAFYTLKKEKMNWPFNTEAPLTYETIRFGVTFTF